MESQGMSERAACRLVGQHRSTQRRLKIVADDEPLLIADMHRLATEFPRYGYRRIHQMLLREGWRVNRKCVQRLSRKEGLRITRKAHKRRPVGHSGNSCTRHRAEHKNHVWTYDFLFERTEDGRQVKILGILDEHTRECLALLVARSIKAEDLIGLLAVLMIEHGVPDHIRSDNGPEFAAQAVQDWLLSIGSSALFIGPGSPWENAYIESFNDKLRDELLDREIFVGLAEAQFMIENFRIRYNAVRIHSSLGYKTPTEFAATCAPSDSASLCLQAHRSEGRASAAEHSPLQLT